MPYFKSAQRLLALSLLMMLPFPIGAKEADKAVAPRNEAEVGQPDSEVAPETAPAAQPVEEAQPADLPRDTNHPDAWAGLTKEEIDRVKKGEVIIAEKITNDDSGDADGAQGYIQAAFVVDQPINVVWRILKQTDLQHEFLPHLDKCELVSRKGNHDSVIFTVSVWLFEKVYKVFHDFDDQNLHSHFYLDDTYDNDQIGRAHV